MIKELVINIFKVIRDIFASFFFLRIFFFSFLEYILADL